MKLIPRRKKSPTPFERATGFVKLGVKGLVVQRLARRGIKTYKFTRRAVPLAGLAAIAAVIAKKVRGGGESPSSYTPPASSDTAGTSATAAATAATGTPPVNGSGTASGGDVPEALEQAGVEGSGPDTPKEAAAPGVGDEQSGETADSAYDSAEAGESPTDDELGVEAPNESTPPPPDKTKK